MGMAQPCHTAFMYTCGCGGQMGQPGDRPGSSPSPPGTPSRVQPPRPLPKETAVGVSGHREPTGQTLLHPTAPLVLTTP